MRGPQRGLPQNGSWNGTTEEHFARPKNEPDKAKQNPKQQGAETARNASHPETENPIFAGVRDDVRPLRSL